MGNMDSMFGFINIAIGAYALYFAIKGEGQLYNKNDYPPDIQEEMNKLLRTVCWIVGPLLLAQGVLDYMGYTNISIWFMVPVMLVLVGYMVIFFRKYHKKIKEYQDSKKNKL